VTSAVTQYTTRLLTPDTWDDFAALVEANNGVWGGCWCIGFHPEGISKDRTAAGNREAKLTHVNNGTIHQMLVYRDGRCVGWSQYGPPAEVASIKNPKAYEKGLAELPDWRIGCLFTGAGSRRNGVARAGVAAVLAAIARAGGGLVEAYPEQLVGRDRNVAPTCIPGQKACSKSSDSSATVASPSGAGSCACASPPMTLLNNARLDLRRSRLGISRPARAAEAECVLIGRHGRSRAFRASTAIPRTTGSGHRQLAAGPTGRGTPGETAPHSELRPGQPRCRRRRQGCW
jgi:hypothetical protein